MLTTLLTTLLASKHAPKLLQNMLHATWSNKRHSLHGLLHSIITDNRDYTQFPAEHVFRIYFNR